MIEYGPNPYLALYYIETENRRQLELETEKFFSEMSIRDPEGREVAYRNKIPEYEKEKRKQMIDFNRPAFTGRNLITYVMRYREECSVGMENIRKDVLSG